MRILSLLFVCLLFLSCSKEEECICYISENVNGVWSGYDYEIKRDPDNCPEYINESVSGSPATPNSAEPWMTGPCKLE